MPILGALMRSTAFQRDETELVIIVEPHLVEAVSAGSLRTPADNFVPPNAYDMILMGRVESPRSGGTNPQRSAQVLGLRSAGGISGD